MLGDVVVIGKHAANGVMQSVGSAQCRSCLYVLRAELLSLSLDLGHSWKEKKKEKGAAISKVRLVQQSFGFEPVWGLNLFWLHIMV